MESGSTTKIAGLALFVSVVAIGIQQYNRWEDNQNHNQERQEDLKRLDRLAQADLNYVEDSFKLENGNTVLTFENRSEHATAAVTGVTFEISDPGLLAQIE